MKKILQGGPKCRDRIDKPWVIGFKSRVWRLELSGE